jgi:hypothetical protein
VFITSALAVGKAAEALQSVMHTAGVIHEGKTGIYLIFSLVLAKSA